MDRAVWTGIPFVRRSRIPWDMVAWETWREPAYGRVGRRRWSAEICCQNKGDGVRFRASHW